MLLILVNFKQTCWSETPAFSKNGFKVSSSPDKSKPLSGDHPTCVTWMNPEGAPISSFLILPRFGRDWANDDEKLLFVVTVGIIGWAFITEMRQKIG